MTQIARQLASKGFTFVASDLYQPLPAALKQALTASGYSPPPSCPRDKILSPTAALLQTFLQHVQSAKDAGDLQVTTGSGSPAAEADSRQHAHTHD